MYNERVLRVCCICGKMSNNHDDEHKSAFVTDPASRNRGEHETSRVREQKVGQRAFKFAVCLDNCLTF
jgi:hypothetical protein